MPCFGIGWFRRAKGLGGISDPYRYYPLAGPKLPQGKAQLVEDPRPPVFQPKTEAKIATDDWFWEGNVVKIIARFLEKNGWKIEATADTSSKERGIDIHATKNGHTMLVETKGYPSTSYRDPARAAERKPTSPTNQAQHWYSHAALKAMRLQSKSPDAIVAIGLPDFPRYQKLFDETQGGLKKLGIALLTASENGKVITWSIPNLAR